MVNDYSLLDTTYQTELTELFAEDVHSQEGGRQSLSANCAHPPV